MKPNPTKPSMSPPRLLGEYCCRLLALICVLGVSPLAAASSAPKKLNVLLIAVDDLRDSLGCYGNAAVKTPHLDRLAARAVRFERAYVQYTVCNPSRSSFLTGLRPDQSGITDNRTLLRDRLPDVVTLPQLLKEDGRHSAAFGKIFHLGGGRDAALRARWMDLPRPGPIRRGLPVDMLQQRGWLRAVGAVATAAGRMGSVCR